MNASSKPSLIDSFRKDLNVLGSYTRRAIVWISGLDNLQLLLTAFVLAMVLPLLFPTLLLFAVLWLLKWCVTKFSAPIDLPPQTGVF